MSGQHPDQGFTLVEVLLVILVLGLMSTVVVAAAGGFKADAEESSCAADQRILFNAVEAYFAEMKTDVIPATGATLDRYELTLVQAEFLTGPSAYHDIDAAGTLVPVTGSPCTV